ncbi:hypothetical protein [Pseudarthrobacter sp. S9]|uniref:hypothetical protein n=1 Tax=Pseudarthrobacter sp. S9 TaxID=3418421 RepID=UPI003D05FC94
MDVEAKLPVAVIGAGPIGLAAAAHLLERGIGLEIPPAHRRQLNPACERSPRNKEE